jgi:hypothetical protein
MTETSFAAQVSFWFGAELSNDILSSTRSTKRSFSGGNI